jgi:hypothetical protein
VTVNADARAHNKVVKVLWVRTGLLVSLGAGVFLLLLVVFGPLVYLVRITVRGCKRGWLDLVSEYREWNPHA